MKKNFLQDFNSFLMRMFNTDIDAFTESLAAQISAVTERSKAEKSFLLSRMEQIRSYSREQAVDELIKILGISEKIARINSYISSLKP